MTGELVKWHYAGVRVVADEWAVRLTVDVAESQFPEAPVFEASARSGHERFEYRGATIWRGSGGIELELYFAPAPRHRQNVVLSIDAVSSDSIATVSPSHFPPPMMNRMVGPWQFDIELPGKGDRG